MKNLKIGLKLYLMVGLALLFTIILGVASYFSLSRLAKASDNNYKTIVIPTGYASNMANAFSNIRTAVRDVCLSTSVSDNRVAETTFTAAVKEINTLIDSYNKYISDFNITSGEEYNTIKEVAANFKLITQYGQQIIDEGLKNNGNSVTFRILKQDFSPIASSLQENFDKLVSISEVQSRESNIDNQKIFSDSTLLIVLLSILALIVLLGFSAIVIKSITVPVDRMVEAAEQISLGNLNVNLVSDSKDEIGMLSGKFIALVSTLRKLIDDLAMLSKYQDEGDMDARIDSSYYKGAYSELANGLNDMLQSYVDSTKDILSCVAGFGAGDFNAPLKKYPGKKAMFNESIEGLRKNMFSVSGDIQKLVGAALEGNLTIRVDANNYKGDWNKVIVGLNDVMEAIAEPIDEASNVMDNLANGDFSLNVRGNYKGSFAKIKESLNKTILNISRYIKEISATLGAVSDNNLDVEITSEYVGEFVNIKNSINNIVDRLNAVLNDIGMAAEQVAAGAKQISESSMTLAEGATEQASSIENLTATVTSVNEKTRKNAESAMSADGLSNESKKNAASGSNEMRNMLTSIQGIKESSNNISNIIKVIDDIAFQTNLLALNAAVEAARAGQYGKGFAVVAEEVRSLAARSQNAARETTALIEDSINKVNEGTAIAGNTSKALEKIVGAVAEVSDIITGISSSSKEQSESISLILDGANQISDVIQQNSSTSEESAAAAQELSSQSDVLRSMIGMFKLRGNKNKGEASKGIGHTELKPNKMTIDVPKQANKPAFTQQSVSTIKKADKMSTPVMPAPKMSTPVMPAPKISTSITPTPKISAPITPVPKKMPEPKMAVRATGVSGAPSLEKVNVSSVDMKSINSKDFGKY